MFKSYPRGLSTLFFTEMWERFSYYGMRGLLLLFLVASIEEGGFGLDTRTGAAIYGLYTALVYLLALPGGWIADRLIGRQQAVFVGGVLIACGHFSMAVPGTYTFFIGLGLIIIGTGLLKPNVSAMVGDLFSQDEAKRDAGFSIFYMGINIGSFGGPIICGLLGENINWHLGFGAAGVGMVLGLIQYKRSIKHLGDAGKFKQISPEQSSKDKTSFLRMLAAIGLIVVGFWAADTAGIVEITLFNIAKASGVFIISIVVVYFLYLFILGGLSGPQKKRISVILLLFFGYALFAAGFEQAGSSMNLFAKESTNRVIFGWEMPASWLQSVNALFIIIMAPIMGSLWLWLRHRNPSLITKFSFGLLLLGSGFLVIAWGASFNVEGGPGISPMWLVVTYYLHTIGELCLSPVGLSAVSKLSPRHLVGQMMGIWFVGASLGNLIAGLAAGQMQSLPVGQLFSYVAIVSIIAGIVFLMMAKPVNNLLAGADQPSVMNREAEA